MGDRYAVASFYKHTQTEPMRSVPIQRTSYRGVTTREAKRGYLNRSILL